MSWFYQNVANIRALYSFYVYAVLTAVAIAAVSTRFVFDGNFSHKLSSMEVLIIVCVWGAAKRSSLR
jgi:hypothetical protein